MNTYDIIEFAEAWVALGGAVQDQVKAVLSDPQADVNPAAIRLAVGRLPRAYDEATEEIMEALQDYLTFGILVD